MSATAESYFCTPNLVLYNPAKVAHLVEHDLAKVGVAGSSPVFRSKSRALFGIFFTPCPGGGTGRHAGLKILFAATRVRVRFPPGALSLRLCEGIFFCYLVSIMPIILFDNTARNQLYPFTHTRAVGTIRSGIFTPQERWQHIVREPVQLKTTNLLQPLYEELTISSNTLWIDAALILNNHLIEQINGLETDQCLYDATGLIAGVGTTNHIEDYANSIKLDHQARFNYASDLIAINDAQIRFDFRLITAHKKSESIPDSCATICKEQIFIEEGATILNCHLNASTGPIYITSGAEIQEGSCIRGPFYLGKEACVKMNTVVYGATTIGPKSIIGGEVKNSILFGYSNKAHHGYLGDSVIGEWCNLGAGTSNSNVKNTAGNISVWDESLNSKRYVGNKMGVCMGDYVKTAINTSITTGATIGVGANVFCAGLTPSYIPHFSWGSENKTYQIDKLISDTDGWKAFKNEYFSDMEKQLIRSTFDALTNKSL